MVSPQGGVAEEEEEEEAEDLVLVEVSVYPQSTMCVCRRGREIVKELRK